MSGGDVRFAQEFDEVAVQEQTVREVVLRVMENAPTLIEALRDGSIEGTHIQLTAPVNVFVSVSKLTEALPEFVAELEKRAAAAKVADPLAGPIAGMPQ